MQDRKAMPRPGGSVARETAQGALAGLLVTLGTFVTGVIVARLLGVEGSGEVALLVWIAFFLATILDLGMASAALRFIPELRGRGDAAAAAGAAGEMLRLVLVSTLLFGAGCAVLLLAFDPGRSSALLWGLVAACAAMQALGVHALACLRGARDFRTAARITAGSALVQVLAVAAGAAAWGVAGALAGHVCAQAVLAAFAFRAADPLDRAGSGIRRRILRYAAFAWLGNVANAFVWSRMELFFLERHWGAEAAGLFAAALALTALATRLPVVLTLGMVPLLSEQKGRQDLDAMRQACATGTRLLALVLFPGCLGLAAVMPVLLPLLYGPDFAAAVAPAAVLAVASLFSVGATVLTNLIWAMERSDLFFALALAGAVLAALAGVTVIADHGVMGAAIARGGVQVLLLLPVIWFVAVRLGWPLPFGALARVLAASAVSAAVAFALLAVLGGAASLPAAIALAVAAYLAALRVLRAVPEGDLALLRQAAGDLPARLRGPACLVLRFIGRERMGRMTWAG